MKYIFGVAVIFFLFSASGGSTVLAIGGTPGGVIGGTPGPREVTIENPIKAKSVTELFKVIIDIVLIFAIPIIVFFIIYAGFLYVTARGNAGKIENAHKALLYALIGGLLILGARVLIEVIQGTVNAITK